MSVKNIGRNKWFIVVRLANKKREHTFEGSKLEAQARELELKNEIRTSIEASKVNSSLKPRAYSTFGECLGAYEERSKWSPAVFMRLNEELGHCRLIDNETGEGIWERLDDFVDNLRNSDSSTGDPFSPAYINRHIAQAKAAVKQAYRPLKKIPSNYLEGFPTEKENNIKYRILSNSERTQLYNELPDYLKPLFYYACRVPARVSELVNLTKKSIDTARGVFVLEDGSTKNGDGRWLPIFPEFEAYLKTIPKECDYVFYRKEDHGYLPLGYPSKSSGLVIANFKKAWYSACDRAFVEGYNFHKTRQQSSMQLLYDGWTELEVMMVGGWKSTIAFRRYVHANEMMLMKRLGKWENDTDWYRTLAPVV